MRRASRLATLRALLLFVLIDLGLKLSNFDRVYEAVRRRVENLPPRSPSANDREPLIATVESVRAATKFYYRKREDCVPKALALYYLLRRRRVAVDFRLGVRKYPFAAHAWVEYQGHPLDESKRNLADFQVLSKVQT